MFAALDLQRQVFYARLDQELHLSRSRPPADLVERLMAETLPFPPVQNIAPQVRHHAGHRHAAGGCRFPASPPRHTLM
jgi:hypothetical protein